MVKALLSLSKFRKEGDKKPLVEVVVMSRNSPETGVCVLNNIRSRDLPITRSVFAGGESVVDYLEAYDVDLFLTTNILDAQRVIDGQVCAAAVVKKPPHDQAALSETQVRIAFDGDADRMGVIDEQGALITADRVLTLTAAGWRVGAGVLENIGDAPGFDDTS